MTLTPLAQGIHLPENIYTYMDDNFFRYICHTPKKGRDGDVEENAYLTLERCECRGRNYFGMPNFDIEMNVEGNEKLYYYKFSPSQFELFPKVDTLTRTTYCNLSLWNLADQYPDIVHDVQHAHNWSIGQVFMRQYGLNI